MLYEILGEYTEAAWDSSGGRYDSIHIIYVDIAEKKMLVFNTNIPKKELIRIEYCADIILDLSYEKMIDTKPFQSNELGHLGVETLFNNNVITEDFYHMLLGKIRQIKIDYMFDN